MPAQAFEDAPSALMLPYTEEIAASPADNPPPTEEAVARAPARASAPALGGGGVPPLVRPETARGARQVPSAYVRKLAARKGSSLAEMLTTASSARDAYAAIAAMRPHHDPRRIRVGDVFHAVILNDGARRPQLARLLAEPTPEYDLAVWKRADGGYDGARWAHEVHESAIAARGTIESSLFRDARRAGMPAPVIVSLIRMFAHRVDFQREIRPGDRFEALFHERRNDQGERVRAGPVVYASLTTRAGELAFWRHKPEGADVAGYYDAQGRPLAQLLMRTPIDGAQVSSNFGMRKHPVLGYNKLHAGVDFAAPTGTPVYAAGDGVVETAGRKGSYGHYIRIRHAMGFKTAYAHLHGYAKNIRKGTKVRQGQVIGYVGSTGRSTGPHLHYEVHKGGRKTNPTEVKLPEGRPLDAAERARFFAAREKIIARMDALAPAEVDVAERGAEGGAGAR